MNIRWAVIRDKLIRLIKRKNPLPLTLETLTLEIETSRNPEKDKDDDPIPILNYFLILAKYNDHDYYLIVEEDGCFGRIYVLSRNFPFRKNIGIYTLCKIINTVKDDCMSEIAVDCWREVLRRMTSEYKIVKEYNIKQIKRGD